MWRELFLRDYREEPAPALQGWKNTYKLKALFPCWDQELVDDEGAHAYRFSRESRRILRDSGRSVFPKVGFANRLLHYLLIRCKQAITARPLLSKSVTLKLTDDGEVALLHIKDRQLAFTFCKRCIDRRSLLDFQSNHERARYDLPDWCFLTTFKKSLRGSVGGQPFKIKLDGCQQLRPGNMFDVIVHLSLNYNSGEAEWTIGDTTWKCPFPTDGPLYLVYSANAPNSAIEIVVP